MNIECPRINDAAGYVLSALPDSEAEAYRHHVTECAECSAKVDELRFVSHTLYSAAPQLSAPPEIFHRVMSVVRAESELLQAAGASADRPTRQERRGWLNLGFARLRPVTAGALAAVLIALGLGTGALLGGGSDPSCTSKPVTLQPEAGVKATGELRICDGEGQLALVGMQSPPDGRIYEVWLDDPSDRQGPKAGALFSPQGGRASVDVGKVSGGRTVLVTHEPSPHGSEVPTRTPIVKVAT